MGVILYILLTGKRWLWSYPSGLHSGNAQPNSSLAQAIAVIDPSALSCGVLVGKETPRTEISKVAARHQDIVTDSPVPAVAVWGS